MADLSKQNQRRDAQEVITKNRDAILPTRREDRVPDVRVASDLRTAQRSDRNVEEVRRALGLIQDTAGAYYQHDIAQRTETAKDTFSQGTLDASAGKEIDPAHAQAVAYQRAYYSVTASARQTKFETETAQGLDDLINQGGTPEDIDAYMGEQARTFIEETTDLFGDRDIQFQVGTRLSRWANETEAKATAVLKEKTDKELLDLTGGEVQAALQRGEGLDLLGTVDRLTQAGLPSDAVQETVVNSALAYAQETGDNSALYSLLDARRAGDLNAEIADIRETANATVETVPIADIEGSDIPSVAAPPAPATASTSTYVMPVEGRLTSGMGARTAPIAGASTNHGGIDLAVPVGTPVNAPAAGRVVFAGPRGKGGNTVIIEHADGVTTGYAHLSTINVKVGDTVTQGVAFAKSGNTGNSTGPHLHFSARRNGERIDPRSIMGQPAPAANAPAGAAAPTTTPLPAAEPRRPRVPGASVLTPQQQVRVLNAIEQVEADTERKTEKERLEAKDALTLDLWERSNKGEDVAEIIQTNVRSGVLEPGEGMSMTNAFRSLRNDIAEGEADEDLVLNYANRFAVGEPNYAGIASQADRDYQAGRFGTGRAATKAYIEIKTRAANGSRADRGTPPEERRTATVARQFVGGTIGDLVGDGAAAPRRRLGAEAMLAWEGRVARGEAPMTAADAVIQEFTPRFVTPRQTPVGGGNTRAAGQTRTGDNNTTRPGETRVDRNGNVIP